MIDMAPAEQPPITTPAFAVVRRGYDPDQVAYHLNRVDAETTILAADRAAAVEQASQLGQQLAACRKELASAHAEIERLRGELRVLSGPPEPRATTSPNSSVWPQGPPRGGRTPQRHGHTPARPNARPSRGRRAGKPKRRPPA
jgi:hypothetical protein